MFGILLGFIWELRDDVLDIWGLFGIYLRWYLFGLIHSKYFYICDGFGIWDMIGIDWGLGYNADLKIPRISFQEKTKKNEKANINCEKHCKTQWFWYLLLPFLAFPVPKNAKKTIISTKNNVKHSVCDFCLRLFLHFLIFWERK